MIDQTYRKELIIIDAEETIYRLIETNTPPFEFLKKLTEIVDDLVNALEVIENEN